MIERQAEAETKLKAELAAAADAANLEANIADLEKQIEDLTSGAFRILRSGEGLTLQTLSHAQENWRCTSAFWLMLGQRVTLISP